MVRWQSDGLQGIYAQITKYYFLFRKIKRELSRNQAYHAATELGKKEIYLPADVNKVIKRLRDERKHAHFGKRLEVLLTFGVTRVVDTIVDDKGATTELVYYTFQNETDAQDLIKEFLYPSLTNMHDPFLMPDMEGAVGRQTE